MVDVATRKAQSPPVTLPEALRASIRSKGLTQSEAAERLGVTQQTLSSWMTSKNRPGPDKLRALARFLNIPVAELVVMLEGSERDALNRALSDLAAEVRALRADLRRALER